MSERGNLKLSSASTSTLKEKQMYYQRNRSKTILHVLAALLLSAAMAAAVRRDGCRSHSRSLQHWPFKRQRRMHGPRCAPRQRHHKRRELANRRAVPDCYVRSRDRESVRISDSV